MGKGVMFIIPKAGKGFSLVELMVALVISLIVSLGAIQLFLTTKSTFREVERVYERQSVLDYLQNVISQEVRIANGPVYPADSGSVNNVAPDSSNLLITLDESAGLDYDPYCGGDLLEAVEYYASGADVMITYECGRVADSSIKDKSSQTIVSGVSGLHFYGDSASSASVTIVSEVTLSPFSGESLDKNKFLFKMTNRKEVVDSF